MVNAFSVVTGLMVSDRVHAWLAWVDSDRQHLQDPQVQQPVKTLHEHLTVLSPHEIEG
jgi:hypothetical protein